LVSLCSSTNAVCFCAPHSMRPFHSVRISEVICVSPCLYFVCCTAQRNVYETSALTYLWGLSPYTVFRRVLRLMTSVFRRVVPVLFYLQLNRGSFESKHNCLILLSLFQLTPRFGLCTGSSSGHKTYNFFCVSFTIPPSLWRLTRYFILS